jgi:hypothetical protein
VADRRRLVAERRAEWQPISDLVASLLQFVRETGPDRFQAFDAPLIRLPKGEAPGRTVQRLRARLVEVARERATIEKAPVSSTIARERARVTVESLAAAGRPGLDGLLAPEGGDIAWPMLKLGRQTAVWQEYRPQSLAMIDHVGWAEPPTLPDTFALSTWIDPEALLTRLYAEIDATAAPDGLSAEERGKRLFGLDEERLQIERAEEVVIMQAEAEGLEIMRRADADPRAVLQVDVVDPEPAEIELQAVA